jgi:hypothetical protein
MIAPVSLGPVTSVVDFHAQPALGATAQPVPTDLPPAQAISSAANIPTTRNDPRKADKVIPPGPSKVVIIDPPTSTIVFRSLDVDTGGVIEQVPAQALLRRRAYEDAQVVQALIKGENPTAAVLAAVQNLDTTT